MDWKAGAKKVEKMGDSLLQTISNYFFGSVEIGLVEFKSSPFTMPKIEGSMIPLHQILSLDGAKNIEWKRYGKLHREDVSPTVINSDGSQEWYVKGKSPAQQESQQELVPNVLGNLSARRREAEAAQPVSLNAITNNVRLKN